MVRITACVITKNEEHNIEQWIHSMKKITKDLVVVDTGSADHTVEIAKANGAKVYFYEWKKDFAAARNFAIEQAKGDWIIFLDADEYFSAESARNVIRYIELYHAKKIADALVCKIINIDADDNQRFISEFYNLRIFKNTPALRYIRPVHEMLSKCNGDLQTYIIPDGVEVYHTGYSSSIIEKKLKRNLSIILAEIDQKGEQRQHYRYLCECYHGLKQHDLAEKYARLHIECGERSLGRDNSIHKRMIESMMLTRQEEEKIIAEIDQFMGEFPDDPEFLWYKGELLFSKQEYGGAEQALLKFIEMAQNLNAQKDYGQSTLYSKLCAAYYPLGLIAEYRGDKIKAIACYKKSLKRYRYNNVALPRLLKNLADGTEAEVIKILDDIYTNSLTDIKFIVKHLENALYSPVYRHYHARLKKQTAEGTENKFNAFVATRQYDCATKLLSAELAEYYEVFLLIITLQPSLYDERTIAVLLPAAWQKVCQKMRGEVIALNTEETAIFVKVLNQLPDVNRELIQRRLRENEKIQRALPQNADELYVMAAQAYREKNLVEAENLAKQALAGETKYDAEAYKLLGLIYHRQEKYVELADVFEKSLRSVHGLQNDFSAGIAQGLGRVNLILGDIEQAKQYYLCASLWCTDEKEKLCNYSSYLLCCHYNLTTAGEALFQAHCKYQELLPKPKYMHKRKKSKEQIRVGYISADFREHVMAHFYDVFLDAYDKEIFFVACYSLGEEDEFTETLKKMPELWRNVAGKSPEEIADIIYHDDIDILVDLGGHSANSGLPVLAYKPAPIQISGLGYFNTTGLETVDYFITDIHLASGVDQNYFVEKLLEMPYSHFCYTRRESLPRSQAAPCAKNGYVTFGCFNQYAKITDEMLKMWQEILDRVEHAILILKCQTFICEEAKFLVEKRLKKIGFDLARVKLEPPTQNYMVRYLDIDIALDTYPYQGGGTTCDALYMGVPVITLVGERHGARFGYSILKNIGLEELAVHSETEYIERAVGLAGDTELLTVLHQNLRGIMNKSLLMDKKLYMKNIENFYRNIISDWD